MGLNGTQAAGTLMPPLIWWGPSCLWNAVDKLRSKDKFFFRVGGEHITLSQHLPLASCSYGQMGHVTKNTVCKWCASTYTWPSYSISSLHTNAAYCIGCARLERGLPTWTSQSTDFTLGCLKVWKARIRDWPVKLAESAFGAELTMHNWSQTQGENPHKITGLTA